MLKSNLPNFTLDNIDTYLQPEYLTSLSLRDLGALKRWCNMLINARVGADGTTTLYRTEGELTKLLSLRKEVILREQEGNPNPHDNTHSHV